SPQSSASTQLSGRRESRTVQSGAQDTAAGVSTESWELHRLLLTRQVRTVPPYAVIIIKRIRYHWHCNAFISWSARNAAVIVHENANVRLSYHHVAVPCPIIRKCTETWLKA